MTANNNSFAADESTVSAQNGSILLLAVLFAFVRPLLMIIAAVSLGAPARYFFPEMFVLGGSPILLIAVVAADTFAISLGALKLYGRPKARK